MLKQKLSDSLITEVALITEIAGLSQHELASLKHKITSFL